MDITNDDLTVSEAATRLKLHPNTVRAMIKAKELGAYKIKHQYRIPLSAIERLRANATH